ncbi:hypothetical protein ACFU53_19900 [Streptomyces sp. NPDC057474]|uniref:hypothetical protein n=1 Tax=Streptomyces sp. NPDC057474 TaxID=3346144 RepID=UPI003675F375
MLGGFGRNDLPLTVAPTVVAIRVEDARITGLYYVHNPEKLPEWSPRPLSCDDR